MRRQTEILGHKTAAEAVGSHETRLGPVNLKQMPRDDREAADALTFDPEAIQPSHLIG